MCVKYIVLVLFQIYILVTPEAPTTVESIVSEEFEQVVADFILQYHIAKFSEGNTTGIIKTPTKYINEDFSKSELYKQFQLQKYLAVDSKCENICFNLNYEIDKDHDIPVPTISTEPDTTSTEPASTDTTSTELASIDTTSTEHASIDIVTNTEGNQIDETTTAGSEGTDDTGSGRQTQEKLASGDKKTAVIVAATVMAVGAVTVAFIPVVTWVKTLLQSGTYVFPGSPNV